MNTESFSDPTMLPDYKDRSTGLTIFGILTLLLGCLCGLFVPLILLGQVMAAKVPNAPAPNLLTILPGIVLYGVLAVALTWLGIGSIMKRRWARALLLIFSWTWLVIGIFSTVITPFMMSKALANLPPNAQTGQPLMPPAAITGMIIGMTIFLGLFFVLLPGIYTYFYSSRHVKATCEDRDPVRRWTDTCPLPVLALSLWTWLSVPMMVGMSLTGHSVQPFFGMFLTGLPGSLSYLIIAAIWGISGWWLYRLDSRGWWLILIMLGAYLVSNLLTFTHHDFIEIYSLMGYPQTQIDQIQKSGLLVGNRMVWLTALGFIPVLGYLLCIKKYLRKSE